MQPAPFQPEFLNRLVLRMNQYRSKVILDALPIGTVFRLDGRAGNAYCALYVKNEQGMFDQIKGTCPPPHVINLDSGHLGFVVHPRLIREAVQV